MGDGLVQLKCNVTAGHWGGVSRRVVPRRDIAFVLVARLIDSITVREVDSEFEAGMTERVNAEEWRKSGRG